MSEIKKALEWTCEQLKRRLDQAENSPLFDEDNEPQAELDRRALAAAEATLNAAANADALPDARRADLEKLANEAADGVSRHTLREALTAHDALARRVAELEGIADPAQVAKWKAMEVLLKTVYRSELVREWTNEIAALTAEWEASE